MGTLWGSYCIPYRFPRFSKHIYTAYDCEESISFHGRNLHHNGSYGYMHMLRKYAN